MCVDAVINLFLLVDYVDMPGLKKHSSILEKILGELDPILAEHFVRNNKHILFRN